MTSAFAARSPSGFEALPMSSYAAPTSETPSTMHRSDRNLTRTPSPTPSEYAALSNNGLVDWSKYKNWDYWKEGHHFWILPLILILVALVILSLIFHTQIVIWLQPAASWMYNLPAGWLIPVAILFVMSFPPLFGHEIVAVLCGVVWGVGPGFGIVALGTLLGEWGNYFAFKYMCQARAEKMEKSSIRYAALAKTIRDGGFVVVLPPSSRFQNSSPQCIWVCC
ncbi:hypothetical protein OE88DRAFT_1655788 [Heliocybe sulcata]|uniref:Golgi apparatus membrane protein TVP38 n=1 Tax=Heliocybe sulcata TaxID=5364 RepID=A0A5C3NJ12_9AGAM|nr:hypothetical protein OE88DRAFT_1655788 [Heliocybe sulcata]